MCQVQFSASTERTKITLSEQVTVAATLITPAQVPNLSIPPVATDDAFTLLKTDMQQSSSSSIQIINGKASQKNEISTHFLYVITPRRSGSFTFPALSVNVNGVSFQTQPIRFTVSTEPVSNPDVLVLVSSSRRSLYPGEQALLTFKVAQRAQAQSGTDVRNGFNSALEKIEQALGKNFALTRLFTNQVTSGSERIDGEIYNVYSLRFSIFPLSAGSCEIPSLPFEYQELRRARRRADPFFDDFFGGSIFGGGVQATNRTAFSRPLTLEIKPLPPSPGGFSGAVGTFSLNATADPREIPAGEAVTLTVSLQGNTRPGNMGDIVIGQREDFELFAPEKQVVVDTGEAGISTRKSYKYLLIPKKEGTLTLDPISYVYFNSREGSYATAASPPLVINVTRGKDGQKEQGRYLSQEEIREVGRDIRYIKTTVNLKHQSRQPYREPLFYMLFPLPLLFLGLSILYRFQSTHRERNVALQRRNRALASALKQLSYLRKQGKSISQDSLLSSVSSTIEAYISHKFGFPATGRTLEELREKLLDSMSDEATAAGLTSFIEQIDNYRFGGASFDDTTRSSVLDQAASFLNGLERGTKKERTTMMKKALTVAAVLLVPALARSAPLTHWFEKANEAYSSGQFDSAAHYYESIIESGMENSTVFYNYGNALFRLKKLGQARLAYEKAAVLDPDDPDITSNLRFIQSNIVDRVSEPERGFLDNILWKLHVLFSLKQQLWIALIVLSLTAFLAGLSLFVPRNVRLWLIYFSVLTCMLLTVLGISIGVKVYDSEKTSYAIVLVPSTEAMNEPEGTTVLFTAHEGTKFRIRKNAEEWVLVSLPNGVSGWVQRKDLGTI